MIKCPNCCAEMSFDPEMQKVKCEYCGSTFTSEELKDIETQLNKAKEVIENDKKEIKSSIKDKDIEVAKERQIDNNKVVNDSNIEKKENTYTGKQYMCKQCGATLLTFDETAITFCSYCGSQAMLEDKMLTQTAPDYVIPFQRTREEVIKNYKNKLSKFLFIPDYLKEDVVIDKIRGIYMPYAIYNLKKDGDIINEGEISSRKGDYIYHKKYQLVLNNAKMSFEGVSFDIKSNFYDEYSKAIPFDYTKAKKFDANYLIGYYADTYDVSKKVYKEDALNLINPEVTKLLLEKYIDFKIFGCKNPKVDFNVGTKIGMFPIYFLASKDKKGKRLHYAVINGQTGEVACDMPVDFKKYILVSLLVFIIIFLILNSFLILNPTEVAIVSIIFGICSLALSIGKSMQLSIKEDKLDDVGVSYIKYIKKKEKKSYIKEHSTTILMIYCLLFIISYYVVGISFGNIGIIILCTIIFGIVLFLSSFKTTNNNTSFQRSKARPKVYFRDIYKEILAIIISISVIKIRPVNDFYYYGATFSSLILVLLSFRNLIKTHNLLTSHKLPQLDKRGGIKE